MMRQFLLFRKVQGDKKRQMFIGRKKELEQLKNDLECKKQIINDNLEEKEYSM